MYSNWKNNVLPIINEQATKSIRLPHSNEFIKPSQQQVQHQYQQPIQQQVQHQYQQPIQQQVQPQYQQPIQQQVQHQYQQPIQRHIPVNLNNYYSTIPMKVNGVDINSYNAGINNKRNSVKEQVQNYMQQQPIDKIMKTQFERKMAKPTIDIRESIIAINELTQSINNLVAIQSMNIDLTQYSLGNNSNEFDYGFDTTNLKIKLSTLDQLLNQGGINLKDYSRIRKNIIAEEIDNNFQ